ncbi:coiled-coil domain-containing protein R3HCC1L-like [Pristis pectinata]|uniref:coiled-coil domain-containing protein R3HCC1L-like n=1 Tax=Pristis pectinata TaxID=685728 RepID=UPI00223E2E36|nr:coiled-coil domain-containing protein R3HCC1L-like [Pristis pectinata]XP_051896984.1 coiled-coil domain-containing protein R3HCC1L-like [Pristis pectinata]
MRLQPLDENESHMKTQWKSNDELTEKFRSLHDGASRYHNLAPGNSKSRNKPDKAKYAHCQNRVEKRRDVRFNYKRDGRYRKPNSSGSKEGREPRRGKEEKDETCGQALEDASGKMAGTEEGRKCTVSNLQHEGENETDPPTEDLSIDPILNDNLDEPEGKQGPSSNAATNRSSDEKRAENDRPRLENAEGLLEDAKPSIKDSYKLQTSMHTAKTSEAIGPSPSAEFNLKDNAALNCDQSQTSNTVDACSTESRHILRTGSALGNEEKSSNFDNVSGFLESADFKAEEEGVVGVKAEDVAEHSQNPNEDLLKELSSCLGESSISIEQPQSDYSTYLSGEPQTYDVDFGHIIEIYDFPPHMKTEDIQEAFGCFRDKGFRIKWVDSSHALGIFSSPDSASKALSISHEQFKTQPLSQATKQSKLKVSRCSEFLQPVKERAQVNTAIAKRLVSRALGFQTTERRGQPDLKPKKPKENKVQPHKTEDDAGNTLNAGAEQI